MRSRILAGAVVLFALTLIICTATAPTAASRQWAIVQLPDATLIAGRFITGTVMFLHDEAKMAAGLPCTEVYRFEPGKGAKELVTSFHCVPKSREVASTFTMAKKRTDQGVVMLTEYQFAGDAEGHGIPIRQAAAATPSKGGACCTAECCYGGACCEDGECSVGGCCRGACCSGHCASRHGR